MKKSNGVRAILIHFIIVIITFILVDIFSIDFESGAERWLAIVLIALYIICGFIFLDTRQKAFVSLRPFLVYFVIISFLLSIEGVGAFCLLFVNPIGLVLADWANLLTPYDAEISAFIARSIEIMIVAIFPPLFLYLGLILRMFIQKLTTKR